MIGPRTNWMEIARLVADGVHVAPGDRVSVFATDYSTLDAVAGFVEECWRRGAVPQVLATDERFDASALRWADTATLETAPPLEAAAMAWSDVHVSFRAMLPPTAGATAERVAALRHGRGIVSTMRWEGTRWALVRLPTAAWAEALGLDAGTLLTEWASSFEADWVDGARRMGALCNRLARCRMVTIEDEWGVLELPVADRTWVPFSGNANWPDGEIATAPRELEVSGRIRFPGQFVFAGTLVRDLELEFDKGLVVSEAAADGLDLVRQLLATDDGARRVGEFGIGTNAALKTPTGDLLIDEKILGTVHIALGRAYPECGGDNRSALHWDIVKDLRIPKSRGTASADDMDFIRDGIVQPILYDAAVATPEAPTCAFLLADGPCTVTQPKTEESKHT